MMARGELSLPKENGSPQLSETDEEIGFTVGLLDLSLPCRTFDTQYKVTVRDGMSPSLEFLMRAVRSLGEIAEDDLGAFFGYSERELQHVLREGEDAGFVSLRKGSVVLSGDGEACFADREEPSILKVERRTKGLRLDLLSLAPAPRRFLSKFELRLPELALPRAVERGALAKDVPKALRYFFRELGAERGSKSEGDRTLYSVDHVHPGARHTAVVPITLVASPNAPDTPEVAFYGWRPDFEVHDRPEIVAAVQKVVDELAVPRNSVDDEVATVALSQFVIGNDAAKYQRTGSARRHLWREGLATPDLADPAPTVPISGPFYSDSNRPFLLSALDIALTKHSSPDRIVLLCPTLPHWGANGSLAETLSLLARECSRAQNDSETIPVQCLAVGPVQEHLRFLGNDLLTSDVAVFPSRLEILLVPGCLVVASVHAPLLKPRGYPVPVGFLSTDSEVIMNVQRLLGDSVYAYTGEHMIKNELVGALRRPVA